MFLFLLGLRMPKTKIVLSSLVLSFLLLTSYTLTVNAQFGLYGQPAATPAPVVAKNKLTQAQLRSCQAKESAIKDRMQSLVDLVANMEEKFSAIEKRVEDFYTTKVVPDGKTVSNYSSLVANIGTKKAAVDTALASAKTDTSNFNCTSDDPKSLFTQFRTDMQKVKSALKDYRTSIKNLIVAVHSVSPTPKPGESPEGKNQ